jgi:uncharacterized protein (DUF362 family)
MAKSRVVLVRSEKVWTPDGGLDQDLLGRMFARGFALLEAGGDGRAAAAALFRPDDRIGIKVNTIGGRAISTRPETALALTGWLASSGFPEKALFIWDRTTRELRSAGYAPAAGRSGVRIFGTDADGVGYGPDLVAHRSVGSLFSRILTELVTASISLAILKDHGLAGVTAGMKNYFGAIHNPNKYHDSNCDPYVAEVFDAPPVKSRHRLTILDALVVQFHRGPSYHARWAARHGGLIFSRDPVAADTVGWGLVEKLRAGAGLATLRDEGRAPTYLNTAATLGLGQNDPAAIEAVEETVA